MGDSIFDAQAVPPSLVDVLPALRAAKEVEPGNFRVAYLCRFYVSEYARRLDPTSSGPGVREFKTLLLETLERENMLTLKWRREKSDAREIEQFYLYYYEKFIKTLPNADAVDKADSDLLTQLCQTAGVLFNVLRTICESQGVEIGQATLETYKEIEKKKKRYALDSILRADPEKTGVQHPETSETYNEIEEKREMYALDILRGYPESTCVQHPKVFIYLKSHCEYHLSLEANNWFYD